MEKSQNVVWREIRRMITDAIVSAFLGAFGALFGLIPNVGPEPDTDGFDGAAQQIALFADIFPLMTLLTIIGIITALEIAIYLWDLTLFVYHQIWGSN
jgi:hypothetical protein